MNTKMNTMDTKKKPSVSLLLAALLSLSLAPAALADSKPRQAGSRKSVEALIGDYYRLTRETGHETGVDPEGDTRARLSDPDKAALATDVFDELLMLPTPSFNIVVKHLAADYRSQPEHRRQIWRLAQAAGQERTTDSIADEARAAYRAELAANKNHQLIQTVLDDAALAFAVGYAFQFGRGMWKGAQSEATGLARLKTMMRMGGYTLYKTKGATALVSVGAGSVAGLVEAAYETTYKQKEDPRRVLRLVQASLVTENAKRAVKLRDEVRSIKRGLPDLRPDSPGLKSVAERLDAVALEISVLKDEMSHLYEVLPSQRSQMEPIAQDLGEAAEPLDALISALLRLLGYGPAETGAGLPN